MSILVVAAIGLFLRTTYRSYQELQRGRFNIRSFDSGEQTRVTPASLAQVKSIPANSSLANHRDDPSFGSPNAKVQIIAFEDFECPYCGKNFSTIQKLRQLSGDDIYFVYRDFPLSDIHSYAQKAAEAGQCAHAQGKFWEFHDAMFQQQDRLRVADLEQLAARLQLEGAEFNNCLESGEYAGEVLGDLADGIALGVAGTPTFFFNGNKVSGVVSLEGFQKIIAHFQNE